MSSRTLFAATLIGLISVMLIPAARAETNTQNALRVAGQVTKIDGKALTITAEGQATVITCTDATKISRDSDKGVEPAKFENLQVGQPIRAYYSKTDNNALAVIIAKAPAAPATPDSKNVVRVAGQVTKIDGKTLTIIATDGKDAVITCTDATKISRDGDKSIVPATFEDVQVGQSVRAYYSKTDNSAAAVIIAKSVPAKSAP